MSSSANENEDVLGRIHNPVVDAWNDTSKVPVATVDPIVPEPLRSPLARGRKSSPPAKTVAPPPTTVISEHSTITTSWVPLLWVLALVALVGGAWDMIDTVASGKVGTVNWRFAVVGGSARALAKPLFAAVTITMALLVSQNSLLSKAFAGLFALVASAFVVLMPMFLMDALQIRPTLPDRFSGSPFAINITFALAHLLMSAGVLALCTWSLLRSVRKLKEQESNVIPESWQG